MILLWSTVSASLIVALLAWRQARRTAKRVRLQRLTGEAPPAVSETSTAEQPGESFVPLSSLKR
jgi:hypothetical protein